MLERLLDVDARARGRSRRACACFTVPRFGTISPWSSKATDIAHVCGLDAVRRIERGMSWCLEAAAALAPESLAALAAPLFDRMTETLLFDAR